MKLTFRTVSGETFGVEFEEATTSVGAVKDRVCAERGLEKSTLKLLYKGKALDKDGASLSEAGLSEEGFIVVFAPKAKPAAAAAPSPAPPAAAAASGPSTTVGVFACALIRVHACPHTHANVPPHTHTHNTHNPLTARPHLHTRRLQRLKHLPLLLLVSVCCLHSVSLTATRSFIHCMHSITTHVCAQIVRLCAISLLACPQHSLCTHDRVCSCLSAHLTDCIPS